MHYFFKKTRVNIQELTFCLKMQQEQLLVCLNIENGIPRPPRALLVSQLYSNYDLLTLVTSRI